MDELTPQARALLDLARSSYAPSADQLARLRARRPDAPSDPGPTTAGAATKSGWIAWAIVAVIVVAAAIVWATRTPPESPEPEPEPEVPAPVHATLEVPPPLPVAPERVPVVATASTSEPSVPAAPRARAARPAPRKSTAAPAPAIAEPTPDELAAQLELIGGARRAINASGWSRARELVDEYRRRFPSGAFASEADVLDLLADCGEHPGSTSRERALQYLARPGAAFAERVRRRCLDE